ncbi:hypothetical protein JB92DRAFT_2826000 [Gautieria morchelliformis]|nr:hypothetical protein JB92DRAFT_2826000 [Gautieria morchelliformis]
MSTFSSSVLQLLTSNNYAHTYIANNTTQRTFGRRDIGSICTSCLKSSDAQLCLLVALYPSLSHGGTVGQHHLQDSCYAGAEAGDKGKESHLGIEQQLAQWIITKNFLLGTQGKAILQLYGEGDLTGHDETFSSIQVFMKLKLRIDPSLNTDTTSKQQTRYNEGIVRIWNNQWNSLFWRTEPKLMEDEEEK